MCSCSCSLRTKDNEPLESRRMKEKNSKEIQNSEDLLYDNCRAQTSSHRSCVRCHMPGVLARHLPTSGTAGQMVMCQSLHFFLHACRLLPYVPGCLHKTSYIPSPCLSQTSALVELGQCGGHSLSHCRGWIQPLRQHTSMCQFSFMANLQSSRTGAREHPEMFSPPPKK